MYRYAMLNILLCSALLAACTPGKDSPRGFSFPEGNAEAGKATFVDLQCNACHSTSDIEQLGTPNADEISVILGGKVGSVKTYADLVTSIINPSHRLARGYRSEKISVQGESRMRNYNNVMTVEQLINLVSYLQPHYELMPHTPSVYSNMYP